MSQVVAVRLGNLTRLHFYESGANLWRYEDIADMGSVIIDSKAHFDNFLRLGMVMGTDEARRYHLPNCIDLFCVNILQALAL